MIIKIKERREDMADQLCNVASDLRSLPSSYMTPTEVHLIADAVGTLSLLGGSLQRRLKWRELRGVRKRLRRFGR